MPILFTPGNFNCATYTNLIQIDERECVGNTQSTLNFNFSAIDVTFDRIFNWCNLDRETDCVDALLGCYCGIPTPLRTQIGFVFGDGNSVNFKAPPTSFNGNCAIPFINESSELDYVVPSVLAGLVRPIGRTVVVADSSYGPQDTGGAWVDVATGNFTLPSYNSSSTVGAYIGAKATARGGQVGNVVGARILIGSERNEVARAEVAEQEANQAIDLYDYDHGFHVLQTVGATVPYVIQYKSQSFYSGINPGTIRAEIYVDAYVEKLC